MDQNRLGNNNRRVCSCVGCRRRVDTFKQKDFSLIKSDDVAEKVSSAKMEKYCLERYDQYLETLLNIRNTLTMN